MTPSNADTPGAAQPPAPGAPRRPYIYAAAGSCLAVLCLVIGVGGLYLLAGSPAISLPGRPARDQSAQQPLPENNLPSPGTLPGLPEQPATAPDVAGATGALLQDSYEDPGNTAVALFGPASMEFEIDQGAGVGLMTAHNPGVLVAVYDSPVVANFEATLELAPLDPVPGAGYGMVFRSDDAADGLSHYFLLLASPADGNVALSRWGPGGLTELGRVPFTPAGGLITLVVRAQAGYIEIEVDGQPGIQVLDAAAEPGIFGLAMLSPRDGDQVAFWNFVVMPTP